MIFPLSFSVFSHGVEIGHNLLAKIFSGGRTQFETMNAIGLNELTPGARAVVTGIRQEGEMRRRLREIGLTDGSVVECLGKSPSGDPTAYLIRGAVIAIRAKDSRNVRVTPIPERET